MNCQYMQDIIVIIPPPLPSLSCDITNFSC